MTWLLEILDLINHAYPPPPKSASEEQKCNVFVKNNQLDLKSKDEVFNFILHHQKELSENQISLSGAFFFIYAPSFVEFKEGELMTENEQATMDLEWDRFSKNMKELKE